MSIFESMFSLRWGLSIKQRNNLRPIQNAFWCLHMLVEPRNLLDVIQRHGLGHILWQQVESIAYSQRMNISIALFSAIDIATQRYVRSSKGTFPSRITFTTIVEVLRKINPVFPSELAVSVHTTILKREQYCHYKNKSTTRQ